MGVRRPRAARRRAGVVLRLRVRTRPGGRRPRRRGRPPRLRQRLPPPGPYGSEGCGRRETLQCPYHAWTYRLDGSLARAPRADREPGFDPDELSLLPVSVGDVGAVRLREPGSRRGAARRHARRAARPRRRGAASTSAPCAFASVSSGAWTRTGRSGVENYLECYHCPVAHPGFSKVIDVDPDEYALETRPTFSSQFGPVRKSALGGGAELPYDPTRRGRRGAVPLPLPGHDDQRRAGPAQPVDRPLARPPARDGPSARPTTSSAWTSRRRRRRDGRLRQPGRRRGPRPGDERPARPRLGHGRPQGG